MKYKETKEFKKCNRVGEIYSECSSDYSLPDYNGDIRKILFTDAAVHPSGSFEDGDSVDFSGIVSYTMVYSDSENRINSVSFSSDYDFSVKCDGEKREAAFADISVASYAMRLLGPRKISAKATLSAAVTTAERVNMAPEGTAFSTGDAPEVKCESLDILSSGRCESHEREYADELVRLDGAIADEVNVIYSDAECYIESASAEGDGISLRGNIRAFAIVQNGDEPICLYERNIRIDESVPFEGLNQDMRIIPYASPSSVRCAVNADENGCSVVINVIVGLHAENIGNERTEVITDAYRCDMDTRCSFEEFRYSELVTNISERDEFSSSIDRAELELENIREIMCLSATPKIENLNFDGEVCTLSGEIKYSGIISTADEDGRNSYHPFKTTVDFEKNVNLSCKNDSSIKILPLVSCHSSCATVDENRVYLSAKAEIKLNVSEAKCVKILVHADVVEEKTFENADSKIVVYYPESEEGLFDIAKRFHTTVEKIMDNNTNAVRAMSGEGTAKTGTQKLIIF